MTLLEKAKQEHPELDEEKLVTWMCPCDLGYESLPDGCEQEGAVQEICRECWNRQADAASGGESQPVCSAAVEKCEEEREPEAFFGNRKAVGQADALSVGCADSKLGMSRVNHASGCSLKGGAKREGGAGDGV